MRGDRGPKSHCTVPGHGMRCEVAEESLRAKGALARWRRARAKKSIQRKVHEYQLGKDQAAPAPMGFDDRVKIVTSQWRTLLERLAR